MSAAVSLRVSGQIKIRFCISPGVFRAPFRQVSVAEREVQVGCLLEQARPPFGRPCHKRDAVLPVEQDPLRRLPLLGGQLLRVFLKGIKQPADFFLPAFPAHEGS